jgi:hypothetical protein
MPRLQIDYQRCVIYKIVSNDVSITDSYVGHTTDMVRRKANHKSDCNNEDSKSYNYKVYTFIRENGGWLNWSMIEIEKFPCLDTHEACKRERYWFEILKATLNSCVPSRTAQEHRKEHYQDNIVEIKEQQKQYRANNSNKIREHKQVFYQANIDKNRKKNKVYYQANAETLKAVTDCECGSHYQHTHKSAHFKSKKHILYCSQIKS